MAIGLYLFFFFKDLFILLIDWLIAMLGLRFCARAFSSCGKQGHSSSRCAGLSLLWPLLLRSTGSRRAGSVVVVHGPSCSAACGIFPDQGLNPCPLHWQADSQPLRHRGIPIGLYLILEGLTQAPGFRLFLRFTWTWGSPHCRLLSRSSLIYLLGLVRKLGESLRKMLEKKSMPASPKVVWT